MSAVGLVSMSIILTMAKILWTALYFRSVVFFSVKMISYQNYDRSFYEYVCSLCVHADFNHMDGRSCKIEGKSDYYHKSFSGLPGRGFSSTPKYPHTFQNNGGGGGIGISVVAYLLTIIIFVDKSTYTIL